MGIVVAPERRRVEGINKGNAANAPNGRVVSKGVERQAVKSNQVMPVQKHRQPMETNAKLQGKNSKGS